MHELIVKITRAPAYLFKLGYSNIFLFKMPVKVSCNISGTDSKFILWILGHSKNIEIPTITLPMVPVFW